MMPLGGQDLLTKMLEINNSLCQAGNAYNIGDIKNRSKNVQNKGIKEKNIKISQLWGLTLIFNCDLSVSNFLTV